jgi:hypothetical protein
VTAIKGLQVVQDHEVLEVRLAKMVLEVSKVYKDQQGLEAFKAFQAKTGLS